MGSMGFAPHTTIVNILQNTGETSIGFLAYKVGREEWEIRTYLETLRKEGIVSIDGNKISLIASRHKGRGRH